MARTDRAIRIPILFILSALSRATPLPLSSIALRQADRVGGFLDKRAWMTATSDARATNPHDHTFDRYPCYGRRLKARK